MSADAHREALRLMRAKDWANALAQIDAALRASPGVPRLLLRKAQCLLALGRREECRAVAAEVLDASPDAAVRRAVATDGVAPSQDARMHRAAAVDVPAASPEGDGHRADAVHILAPSPDAAVLDAIGGVLSLAGDQVRALIAYERAVGLAPADAQFIFNRATVRRFVGQLAAAEADYDRVIALRPGDFEAYKNRSDLRLQTVADNHVAELERLTARGFPDWRGEVQIRHALAKEYEDLGEHSKSFEQLRLGAVRRRAHVNYDVAHDVATVDWIIDAFPQMTAAAPLAVGEAPSRTAVPAPLPDRAAASPDASRSGTENPIFIVGLPRSGTTLVDRILSSHSQVRSAGELNDFALALVATVQREHGASMTRRDLVARSARMDFTALGRDYLKRARATVAQGRFVDKMPLNYLYCGLIHRALPHAKIVHVTRHPMAVGYAMYKTLFKDGYPFSYDLGEIGRYYVAYRRLMDHWQATLPGVIQELAYEDLIADQNAQTRRLLQVCGLPWEEACLAFHENLQASTTASASQVRRPLYRSSLSQWQHYERQLEELRDVLIAAGFAEPGGRGSGGLQGDS